MQKRIFTVFVNFVLIFILLFSIKLVAENSTENKTFVYEIQIETVTNNCSNFSYSSHLIQNITDFNISTQSTFSWSSQLNWTEDPKSIGNLTSTEGNVQDFRDNYSQLVKFPFEIIFSCLDIAELVVTVLQLSQIFPNYDFFNSLGDRTDDVNSALSEIGVQTSPLKFEFAIEPVTQIGRATEFNGSQTLSLGETFRILGNLDKDFQLNNTIHSPDLKINIVQHVEFLQENFIGYAINGTVNGILNNQNIDKKIQIKILKQGATFEMLLERDTFNKFVTFVRIVIFNYAILAIITIILLIFSVITLIRFLRKRKNYLASEI